MVQLSASQTLESLTPPEKEDPQGSPKPDSPQRLTAFQLALNPCSTTYHGYEKYIENGLICLKHKIRNIEKKKLKLESYSDRLKNGDKLNLDQLEAVGKYEEVVHNLKFAKELQKTIDALTQDLLKAQRKAVRQEKVMRFESERTRLSMMLQVQYVLRSLQREDVQRNFCNARQQSCCLSTQEMESLLDLATLLGCKRDHSMSLEEQMERAALVYWELMEGNEKPVAGSTYKLMKEKLLQLVDCGFFDHVPLPQKDYLEKTDTPSRPHDTTSLTKMSPKEVASKEFLNSLEKSGLAHCNPDGNSSPCNWKEDFTALKEREPPDSWEMEFTNLSAAPQPAVQKPWKGAAGLIPKTPDTAKRPVVDPKAKRQNKCKGEHDAKPMAVSVEVFSSPSSLPKDPIQRKQQLETLMDQISGSFSFMQDSLLDGDSPLVQTKRLRPSPGTSTLIAQRILPKNPVEILAPLQITTPIRILGKGCRSGENEDSGSELDASHENKLCNGGESFTAPPLYSRRPAMSLPLENPSAAKTRNVGKQILCNGVSSFPPQTFSTPPKRHSNVESAFHNIHSVFHVPSLPNNDISGLKTNESGFSESMSLSHASNKPTNYSSSSTQTPPELNPAEEDLQFDVPYQLEYPVSTGHMFPIPHPPSRLGQSCYSRNISKVGYDACRVSARSPGRSFVSQNQMSSHKDSTSTLYMARGNGFQQSFKRNTAPHRSSAGWSDSSQVSSPDREGPYPGDSGISDTLSITPLDVPITPQGPHTLMPVHVYPLTQLRVAFSAARTANFAPGTLDQPIAFDLLHSNLGDMFDTATGRFTCPASGTYVFIFHILKLAISVPLYVNLMRNEEVIVSAYANDGAPDHETASNHAVLQLFQGDQVWLRLHRGAIYGSSWKYSTFSGFLLYQD